MGSSSCPTDLTLEEQDTCLSQCASLAARTAFARTLRQLRRAVQEARWKNCLKRRRPPRLDAS